MMTISELNKAEGTLWAERPTEECPRTEKLLWAIIEEFAMFVELTHNGPTEMLEHSTYALALLHQAVVVLQEIGELPPRVVASVMLRVERQKAGLDHNADRDEAIH